MRQLGAELQLQQIPKVELHRHLEGSIRFETLIELAPKAGILLPASIEEQKEYFLVTSPMKDLTSVLHKFLATQKVLSSEEILTRITFEAIEDAAAEGTKILELRYAPTFIADGHHMSWEKIHRAIQKGVEMAKDLPISVGLIGTVQRIKSIPEALKLVDFLIENKETIFGIDLADDELSCETKVFREVFEKAGSAGLGITIHSGEANSPIAIQNVKDAINHLQAVRIGHGIQIISDLEAMDLVKKKNVVLEVCPTSNWLTQAVREIDQHPIRKLMQKDILVTINSDDPGIFAIDLLHEYEVLQSVFGFQKAEFDRCNDIAAQASFIPLYKKQQNWMRPIHKLGPK